MFIWMSAVLLELVVDNFEIHSFNRKKVILLTITWPECQRDAE